MHASTEGICYGQRLEKNTNNETYLVYRTYICCYSPSPVMYWVGLVHTKVNDAGSNAHTWIFELVGTFPRGTIAERESREKREMRQIEAKM